MSLQKHFTIMKNTLKKHFLISACLVFILSLALLFTACGGGEGTGEGPASPSVTDGETTSAETTAAETDPPKADMPDPTLPEKDSYKFLFIGNSATSNNSIPNILKALARKQGINIEFKQFVNGGYTLAQHADTKTTHGQEVFAEIANGGYDAVFLQDNGNCIENVIRRSASIDACNRLSAAIKESGAKLYFYVRPPYEKDLFSYDSYSQCQKFDELFLEISEKNEGSCIFVNRAFAYAIENLEYGLWSSDNAHTNYHGAYLAACTFYATMFGDTSTVLDSYFALSPDVIADLQAAADAVALEGVIPWSE